MADRPDRVSVIGLGYIGLPIAATIASRGIDVIGVDTNERVAACIGAGKAHFSEPDLDILLRSTVQTETLRVVRKPEPADVFVIAVPTPIKPDRTADLSYVEAAARSIAPVLTCGDLIVIESTCPVGASERVCGWIAEERTDLKLPREGADMTDIHVAYCPERILPGRMLFELIQNDRIVGGVTPACAEKARAFYEIFVSGEIFVTKSRCAEAVKLLENAYRDVNIALANEVSVLFEKLNVDTWDAIRLANKHPRVNVLNPGPGVGGHCIAVDPWFLISANSNLAELMHTARRVNDNKPQHVLDKVAKQIERFKDPVVACLGVTYKPDVDDLRESPALDVATQIAEQGLSRVLIVEPNLHKLPRKLAGIDCTELVDLNTALADADIIVVLVAHKHFRGIDRRNIYERIVIDTVGAWQLQPGAS
ncbi:MAG: UDP-N-acetyl-D-mannosamine dehydrogenase [Pseudomonadota bacterium]